MEHCIPCNACVINENIHFAVFFNNAAEYCVYISFVADVAFHCDGQLARRINFLYRRLDLFKIDVQRNDQSPVLYKTLNCRRTDSLGAACYNRDFTIQFSHAIIASSYCFVFRITRVFCLNINQAKFPKLITPSSLNLFMSSSL